MIEVGLGDTKTDLLSILNKCLPEMSNSELRRLVEQGGVKIDGKEIKNDVKEDVNIPRAGLVLKVGKRNWFRIKK
jgi:tyrosyl-tRNA synthetase